MSNAIKSSSWEKDMPNFESISVLDGRNYHKIAILSDYFSELALNKMRLFVEIEYLIHLSEVGIAPPLSSNQQQKLKDIHQEFDEKQMLKVRKIEHTTNHDVKAVEYYLKQKIEDELDSKEHIEFVHWALASEDINNLAFSLIFKNYHSKTFLPLLKKAQSALLKLAERSHYPMLGRTHGQPASVTALSKELLVFLQRLQHTLDALSQTAFYGKLTGATGAYTDQFALDKDKDWPQKNAEFISSLGLTPIQLTTQILPYEPIAHYFKTINLLQETAIDMVQNLWWYVSFDYFAQEKLEKETGSSIMPHKINPIYLEGAEGGFEVSNSLLSLYAKKLIHSRLQRDLSDSTVRRSFGIAFAYSYLSWQSIIEGLSRLHPNPPILQNDLKAHWEIMAAPIQSYLRTKGYDKPYESLKTATRGKTLSKKQMQEIITSLSLNKEDETHLLKMTPEKLAQPIIKFSKKEIERIKNK